jgi:glycosyltransferase involved in cell wall biosynthesis
MGRGDLVTVIIPARDEEGFIGACLDSVLAQEAADLQVIVIDGASKDRTAEIVRSIAAHDARVELIENPAGVISRSLNLALARARGRWLVRVDAHCTIPPGYVRRAVRHLETGEWGGVGGRKDGTGGSAAGRAIAAAMASRFGQGDSVYHYGTALGPVDHIPFGAYPTALVRELGGWDERLPVNQDYEFDYRVRRHGHRLLFDPEIRIEWVNRQTTGDLFRQYRRYGRDKARSLRIHPTSTSLRHLAAPALVATLAGAAVVAWKRPGLALAAVAPYAVAVAAASAITARGVDAEARRHVPGAFLAMHVGWGLGFWQGAASEAGALLRGGGDQDEAANAEPASAAEVRSSPS